MGSIRGSIGDTMAESEREERWGEVKGRVRNRRSETKREPWNGARYIANSRAARSGGNLRSGEGLGATLEAMVQGVAHRPFAGRRRRRADRPGGEGCGLDVRCDGHQSRERSE